MKSLRNIVNLNLLGNTGLLIAVLGLLAGCGGSSGSSASPTAAIQSFQGPAPMVTGFARYLDANRNNINDQGDRLIVAFDQDVVVNNALASDFILPVRGNRFGTGALVIGGPASDEVTITLGANPRLKSRQDFRKFRLRRNDPSGIDVSPNATPGAIQNAGGKDAASGNPVDIAPSFVAGPKSSFNRDTRVIRIGDMNGDSLLDVVEGNYEATNRIWLNVPNANPVGIDLSPLPFQTTSLALGDVDGDNDLDVVEGLQGAPCLVWINNGNLTFSDSGQRLGQYFSLALELADVDSDGDLDLVEGIQAQGNRIYFNDGFGTFTDSGQVLGQDNTQALALGDLDGDGDLDLVEGNELNANRVRLNNGNGVFEELGQNFGFTSTRDVVLGDLDADGDLDLVAGNFNQPNLVWLNDGDALFLLDPNPLNQSIALSQNSTVALAMLDLDGDGNLDLVEGNANSQPNVVWFNDGKGNLIDSGFGIGKADTRDLAAGDLDSDGDVDLAEGNSPGFSNRLWLNSLAETWGTWDYEQTDQTSPTAVLGSALGDLDNDGDLDAVTLGSTSYLILFNDGTGEFELEGQITISGGPPEGLAIADLDGDGDLDFAGSHVWRNDGFGAFNAGQALGFEPTAMLFGDVDADGDPDCIQAFNQDNNTRVWINDGNGVFTPTGQNLGGSNTAALAQGDWDGDGDLDFIEGNSQQPNRVFLNRGDGKYDKILEAGGSETTALAVADINNDGLPDIVEGIFEQSNLIWINQGSGGFANQGTTAGAFSTTSLSLRDVDGDGALDLIEGNSSQADETRIYLGLSPVPAFQPGIPQGFFTNSLATGDLDRDGDVDILNADPLFDLTSWSNE
ncbi:MAG: FG-GAP repeat domain-containing protein [Planctomycetota bacterium]|jgi:hypothetical protein